jgi:hypothetical protein
MLCNRFQIEYWNNTLEIDKNNIDIEKMYERVRCKHFHDTRGPKRENITSWDAIECLLPKYLYKYSKEYRIVKSIVSEFMYKK